MFLPRAGRVCGAHGLLRQDALRKMLLFGREVLRPLFPTKEATEEEHAAHNPDGEQSCPCKGTRRRIGLRRFLRGCLCAPVGADAELFL